MKIHLSIATLVAPLTGALLATLASPAQADAITDWNQRSAQIVGEARIGTPPAVRVMALVQTAAWEAAREASRAPSAPPHAVDAAVAGAHRATLSQLLPAQRTAVEAAVQAALAALPDDAARAAHLVAGERAAQRVLAARAGDMPGGADAYRPRTSPGVYVPTASPAASQWPLRKPWLLQRADQFRPGPPPALNSARWESDYNELKSMGARDSKQRSAEQTETGRFWDYSLPAIYHGVVRSVAQQPGRGVLANARLFAVVAQSMDDALIAVMDAKYHHNFWRPVTAIRNGDLDGHDGTERDAGWAPLIDTPMHPEYPCAHCILAGTVATVLNAEGRKGPLPVLSTTSATLPGVVRRWNSPDEFMREVAQARILGGVHYRNSTEVGLAMGQRIGEWALQRSAAEH
ncbi:MAG: vanadium-dependent haloperoxidase [Hydrogenophaga sp.]|uniref:vanadium-dependent haloperoxidase n=1 Tax=Hydrogenophaga sp. TaxID=1904254 RepID=UPI00260913BB|nr:vanadium-dependent haloperoxidase [Hydrogenophaga sp.]MCV0437884.1 vanadium-dependent haloperoxidase [Hydrogenophaga sp.]